MAAPKTDKADGDKADGDKADGDKAGRGPASQGRSQAAERIGRDLGRLIFAARWLMAPIYVGLLAALVLLVVTFGKKLFATITKVFADGGEGTLLAVLSLLDLALVANLVLMVMLAGWENFVARFDRTDQPEWLAGVDFSALKLKLAGSITVIAAVNTLEVLVSDRSLPSADVVWQLAVVLTLGTTGVLLALMDRIAGKH